MPASDDTDLTLPSILATAAGQRFQRRLGLTLIFHPETSRIGETALLPTLPTGEAPWILGRRSPAFGRGGELVTASLDEPHVSRQALALGLAVGPRVEPVHAAGAARDHAGSCQPDHAGRIPRHIYLFAPRIA